MLTKIHKKSRLTGCHTVYFNHDKATVSLVKDLFLKNERLAYRHFLAHASETKLQLQVCKCNPFFDALKSVPVMQTAVAGG